MSNTFGGFATANTVFQGASSSSATLSYPGGFFPLYDMELERKHRHRFRRRHLMEMERANSLYVPSGRWPARGWILMRKADFQNINPYSTSLQLNADDFDNLSLTFGHLTVVQAFSVSTGLSTDPDAIYLVEITDRRGVLWNQWFQWPTTSSYNALAPAYPGLYYSASRNGGADWTWNTMIQDLWQQMPLLGPYPGLPVVPTGTPQDWQFPGASSWEALNNILDLIGCVITADLTQINPYDIADLSTDDFIFSGTQVAFGHLLEDDLEYLDTGSGRVPLSVTVLFHRVNQYYGTEETIRRDSLQWSSTPLYSVTVNGSFPLAVGHHYLWDDFAVRYDENNNPLAADTAAAQTIAAERAKEYFSRIRLDTQGYLWQRYAGVLNFTTGSRVDGVCWKHNYQDGFRKGWITEIIRGPQPPWPEVEVKLGRAY